MRRFEIALLAAVILGSSPCFAGPPSASAAKTREFREAYVAYDANDAAKAYKILVPFVAQNPAYDAVGLLGQCELVLEKYRDAAEHLTYAIRNTPSGKAEEALPGLKAELADAKARVATLRITTDQNDAEITIDGRAVGKSPIDSEVFADPGKRTIKATHPTRGSAESTLDFKAGEERTVALKLEQQATAGALPPAAAGSLRSPSELDKPSKLMTVNPPPETAKRDGIEARTIVLVGGAAITLIAAGSGTYFGLKARSAKSEAEDKASELEAKYGDNACSTSSSAASSDCSLFLDKRDDQHDAGRFANISFAAAGIAAVATGITYLFWPRSKTSSSAFVVAPIATPHARGLSLQGAF